jgi:hypothetical protein
LDFPILAELDLEHLLGNLSTNTIAPDALGGDTEAKGEPHPLASYHFAAHPPHRLHHRLDVNKLDKRVIRLLDVDFQNLTKLFESFMDFRRDHLSGDVANKEGSSSTIVELAVLSLSAGPVICGMRVEFLDIDEAAENALVARVL